MNNQVLVIKFLFIIFFHLVFLLVCILTSNKPKIYKTHPLLAKRIVPYYAFLLFFILTNVKLLSFVGQGEGNLFVFYMELIMGVFLIIVYYLFKRNLKSFLANHSFSRKKKIWHLKFFRIWFRFAVAFYYFASFLLMV